MMRRGTRSPRCSRRDALVRPAKQGLARVCLLTRPHAQDRIGHNPMPKTRYHYNIMLRPEPEGGFTAIVPALPGCVTYGRTLPEARKMAKDAISGYIKSLKKHKQPIPTDDETLVASLDLEYSH